jgi:hypothetical protein
MRNLRWLMGLSAVALALAGCSNSTNPSAAEKAVQQIGGVSNQRDAIFLVELAHYAPEVSYRHAVRFEGLGHSICQNLTGGATIDQEVTMLGNDGVAADVGEGVLQGAVQGYCTQFKRALATWVSSKPSS